MICDHIQNKTLVITITVTIAKVHQNIPKMIQLKLIQSLCPFLLFQPLQKLQQKQQQQQQQPPIIIIVTIVVIVQIHNHRNHREDIHLLKPSVIEIVIAIKQHYCLPCSFKLITIITIITKVHYYLPCSFTLISIITIIAKVHSCLHNIEDQDNHIRLLPLLVVVAITIIIVVNLQMYHIIMKLPHLR